MRRAADKAMLKQRRAIEANSRATKAKNVSDLTYVLPPVEKPKTKIPPDATIGQKRNN